jgi:hypothetical protein
MNPEQILAALAEVYAECRSYRDAGRVFTRFLPAGDRRPHSSVRPFATAFVRPGQFRFEYRHRYREEDEWDRYIVWAHGAEVRAWWDVRPGVEEAKSLGMALAGATGVSGGSAHTVPALLMPDRVGGRRLTDLVDVTSLGDETLDGVTCYRLSGQLGPYPADPAEEERRREEVVRLTGRPPERAERSPLILWIDRGTLLVRRIEEQTRFETFRTEGVTTYEAAVGAAITDDELRFAPPEQGAAEPP